MRDRIWKRAAAASLAAVMTMGLTACGGGSNASADADKKYFKAEYLTDLPDSFNNNVNRVLFRGDNAYYSANDENYTKNMIYSYNMVTGDNTELYEVSQSDGQGGSSYISDYTVSEDGNVYLFMGKSEPDTSAVTEDYSNATYDDVINYMMEQWGYDNEDSAKKDWEDYYEFQFTDEDGNPDYAAFLTAQNAQYIQTNYIVKVDESGNEAFRQEIEDDSSDVSCNGMGADKDGNLYVALNKWTVDGQNSEYYIQVYDKDGNMKGKIKTTDYINSIITLKDGRVCTTSYGESGCELIPIDVSAMKQATDQTMPIPGDTISVLDEKNILVQDGSTLYKYNLDTQTKEAYFNWMDCNISSSTVNAYSVLSDGRIAVYTQNWNSNGNSAEIALIKEVDASEVTETTELTMAALWQDSDVEEKIIAFNKSQDQYHINLKTYYDGDVEYDDAIKNFTTDITAGSGVDIVLFNSYSEAINFASKGLNVDLYSLIDKDTDLSKDDFISNILSVCEYEGKLAFLPQTFTISTLIGKAEDVGTTPGWTLQQMKDLLASKPDGTELIQGMERNSALSMMMNLGYQDFINMEDSTCNFDSQEFVDVLEFAAMFPETYEWNPDGGDDTPTLLNQGKVLLDNFQASDLENIQLYREIYGGPVTLIGYPTSDGGTGAMMQLNNIMGISNSCKDIDGAWQFLRTFYQSKKSDDNSYSYGFSVRKDDFERFCTDAMKEDGNNVGSGYGWGDFSVEIKPATQEDVDQLKEVVYNTTGLADAVSDEVYNIISEEAAAYFSGQKSADEVAKIIQSRMQVYLSETK